MESREIGATGRGKIRILGSPTQHRAILGAAGKKTPPLSWLPCAGAGELAASEHAIRYEALRVLMLDGQVLIAQRGLAVLLRQGVAVWMDEWAKIPTPPPRVARDDHPRPGPLPEGASADVIRVLVAMTLGHIQQEVHA